MSRCCSSLKLYRFEQRFVVRIILVRNPVAVLRREPIDFLEIEFPFTGVAFILVAIVLVSKNRESAHMRGAVPHRRQRQDHALPEHETVFLLWFQVLNRTIIVEREAPDDDLDLVDVLDGHCFLRRSPEECVRHWNDEGREERKEEEHYDLQCNEADSVVISLQSGRHGGGGSSGGGGFV
ncbi:hypothetical protein U1Q18_021592 [Sarracenia purpurea var. burkii]